MPTNNVQRYREALMMSKAELARKAGLSTLTIDRVEAGRPCRLDTKRKVLLTVAACAGLCVLIGMALYFVGFRMAVQFRPDLVRAVGGVMTAGDVEQRDAEHRTRLAQLQEQMAAAEQNLRQLQALKDSFMQMALPRGQAAPTPRPRPMRSWRRSTPSSAPRPSWNMTALRSQAGPTCP